MSPIKMPLDKIFKIIGKLIRIILPIQKMAMAAIESL